MICDHYYLCVYDTGQSNIGEWQNHGIDHLIRQLIGQAENINILHMAPSPHFIDVKL